MTEDIRKVPNVCKYCRKLMKQPDYPKTLELYRDDMLCLTVDVEAMSKLRLDESTMSYKKYDEAEARRLVEVATKRKVRAVGAFK